MGGGNTVGCFIIEMGGLLINSITCYQVPINKLPLIFQERLIENTVAKILPFIIYKSNIYGEN